MYAFIFKMTENSELIAIFNAALVAVDPYHAVLNAIWLEQNDLYIGGVKYPLDAYNRIVVVGAGKATARMAMAIEALLGMRISAGLIIVKDGHSAALNIIKQVEAAHPVPSWAGVDGTQSILKMAQLADEQTLFICLLSGGASALLLAPAEGLTLEDTQEVTRLLLQSGANIIEMNAVRKHLSAVKGGKLAQAAFPAQTVSLILSDVIGDPLDVIASGPTAPDDSTFADAWAVLEKYSLKQKVPQRVLLHLQLGFLKKIKETVKTGDACMRDVHNVVVGNIKLALDAAMEKSRQLGIGAEIIRADLQGEARDAAHFLAEAARDTLKRMQPYERRCLLSGGETTVTVHGVGMGGRNQELALAFAIEIDGMQGVTLLSAGTDGTDGANDAAGAIVDGHVAAQARQLGIVPALYLANNDSYHFFQKFDASSGEHTHFITGSTGTNVMDMQVMMLNKTR